MFENLIGQDEVRDLLVGDIRGAKLPQSLLFSGPPASGKLSAALELARVLSCARGTDGGGDRAAWNCSCPACSRHRSLTHPDLLLFGRRTFPEEMQVAFETLGRAPGRAGAFFFLRAARKLAKRFDPILFEGEEAKLAKAATLVADLEERLASIVPAAEVPDKAAEDEKTRAETLKAAEAILTVTRKLEALVPDMPPVSQVRAAELWGRLSPWGLKKTIIIENADAMNESARNALLKILEEPPRYLTFVLLTSRRASMMPTILSRVRTYAFAPRDGAASAQVLEKVFRVAGAAELGQNVSVGPTVAGWMAARRPFPPERMRELAKAWMAAILGASRQRARAGENGGPLEDTVVGASLDGLDIPRALALALSETRDFGQKDEAFDQSYLAFLEGLDGVLGDFLRFEKVPPEDLIWINRAADLIREARTRKEVFNLSPSLLIESLAYKMAQL